MSVSLTVMTFNLHEDPTEDSSNSWEKRRDLCISVVTSYSPMILCTQQGISIYLCLWFHCSYLHMDLACGCDLTKMVHLVLFCLCFGGGFLFFWDMTVEMSSELARILMNVFWL